MVKASKVKCFICKEITIKNMELSYLKEGQKTPKYFCSNDHLNEYLHQLELEKLKRIDADKFNEVDLYIAIEILQYELGQITPPNLKRRVKQLHKSYSYEVIKMCFELLKPQLNNILNNKEFEDEQHMVNYIMVVVESNINDAYKIWKRKKEIVDKSKKLEEDLTIFNSDYESVGREVKKSKSKDISSFLTEDEI